MISRLAGVKQPTIYAPPTGLAKTASSSTTIDFSWTGNAHAVEVYKNGTLIGSNAAGAPATFQATGLSAGNTYSFQVCYRDGRNYSPRSAAVVMATSLPAPPRPDGYAVLRTVVLDWINTASGVVIRVYRDGVLQDVLLANSTHYEQPSVADGTYSYTLRYYLASDESSDSIARSVVVAAAVDVPTMPGAGAVDGSSTELNVNWTNGTSGAATKIYRGASMNPTTLVHTTAADATSWIDSGLTKNTTYHYRLVSTKDGIDSAYTSDFTGTTNNAPDAAPSRPNADLTYTDQVTLDWTDGDPDADVVIYRGTSINPTTPLATVSAGVETYVDDTVTPGTTYYYRLRQVQNTVYSAYTADRTAAVPTPNFSGKSISGTVGQTDVVLTWTIGAGPVGATVDVGVWDDGDGDSGSGDIGVSSPTTVPIGFTITTKIPGVTHEVTISVPLLMRDSVGTLLVNDSSFSVTVYKDNSA